LIETHHLEPLKEIDHPILHRVEDLSALASSKEDIPALVEILCKSSDKDTGKFCTLGDAQEKLSRQEEAKAKRQAQEATEHKHAYGVNTTSSQESDKTTSPGETTVDQTFAQGSGTERAAMGHNGSSPQAPTPRALPLHHLLHQLQQDLDGYFEQLHEPHMFSMEMELGHNTLRIVFDSTLSQPKDVTALPTQCPGWGLHNTSTEICRTCVYKTRCEEAQTVIKTEETLII
jgi:hypothetical protein